MQNSQVCTSCGHLSVFDDILDAMFSNHHWGQSEQTGRDTDVRGTGRGIAVDGVDAMIKGLL